MKVNIGKFLKTNEKRKIKIKIHDYDLWNLDHTFALIITPALKKYRDNVHSSPSSFYESSTYGRQLCFEFMFETAGDCEEIIFNQWKETLNRMIWSFEQLVDEDNELNSYALNKTDYDLYQQKIQEGLDLFAKYYQSLWN